MFSFQKKKIKLYVVVDWSVSADLPRESLSFFLVQFLFPCPDLGLDPPPEADVEDDPDGPPFHKYLDWDEDEAGPEAVAAESR